MLCPGAGGAVGTGGGEGLPVGGLLSWRGKEKVKALPREKPRASH